METYNRPQLTDELAARRRKGATFHELEEYAHDQIISEIVRDIPVTVEDVKSVMAGYATAGERTEVEEVLRQKETSLDDLKSDLVTHETIRSYLYEHYDLKPAREKTSETSISDTFSTVEWAMSRAEKTIEASLRQLRRSGAINYENGQLDVDLGLDIQYSSGDSSQSFGLHEFIDFAQTDDVDSEHGE